MTVSAGAIAAASRSAGVKRAIASDVTHEQGERDEERERDHRTVTASETRTILRRTTTTPCQARPASRPTPRTVCR